jgi:hypothetical protein
MALAPLVYTIWNRVMRFDPQDPIWPNPRRDADDCQERDRAFDHHQRLGATPSYARRHHSAVRARATSGAQIQSTRAMAALQVPRSIHVLPRAWVASVRS